MRSRSGHRSFPPRGLKPPRSTPSAFHRAQAAVYHASVSFPITPSMPIRTSLRAGLALVALLAPTVSRAQDTPLSSILPDLLGNTITLLPSNLPDQPNHVAHFRPGADQLLVPTQVNQALLTLLSTYPLGSPSGGFTYTFDPALGTLMRSSASFGPSFADRSLPSGRG